MAQRWRCCRLAVLVHLPLPKPAIDVSFSICLVSSAIRMPGSSAAAQAQLDKGKDAAASEAQREEGEVEPGVPESVKLLLELRDNIRALERAVPKKDERVLIALSKHNKRVRQGVSATLTTALVEEFVPHQPHRSRLLDAIKEIEEREMKDGDKECAIATYLSTTKHVPRTSPPIPEVEVYLSMLIGVALIDRDVFETARSLFEDLFIRIQQWNRRPIDHFSAKAYEFLSLCYERLGRLPELREKLIAAHRSACLRHDEYGQAVLCNLVLRNYLQSKLYTQADLFRLNSTFPEGRSNYQTARYHYYLGKINSVQLHYTDAFENLTQALRKAPTKAAIGFRQTATKLLVIVQMLMGEIPERSVFLEPLLRRSLKPYFQLTQTVRIGDLAAFTSIQKVYGSLFERDDVANLITRLRFNVIKTGLRKISLSYSRISIANVAAKLSLNSVEDAEYIIAKAIHDGVIDAVIDRRQKYVFSNETVDVYSTNEPQAAFHRRIKFCLGIHNEAVKSMRYPDKDKDREEEKDDMDNDHEEMLEALEEELKEEDLEDMMD